jgi:hypothetical protein
MILEIGERLKKDKATDFVYEERGRWVYGGMERAREEPDGEWFSVVDYVVFMHISATMPRLNRKARKPILAKLAAITNGLTDKPIMILKG